MEYLHKTIRKVLKLYKDKYKFILNPCPVSLSRKDNNKLAYGVYICNLDSKKYTSISYLDIENYFENPEKELQRVRQELINKITKERLEDKN